MEEGFLAADFSVECTSHGPASSSPTGGAANLQYPGVAIGQWEAQRRLDVFAHRVIEDS